jgi:hypothetical protein
MAHPRATAVRAITGQTSQKGTPIMARLSNRLRPGSRGVIVAALALAALGSGVVTGAPAASAAALTASAAPNDQACWGQATAVFAATGQLGQHASSEPTPREGLANLARALFDQGVIPAPTMQALGAFVAAQLGLSIDACM